MADDEKTLDPRAVTLRRERGFVVLTAGERRWEGVKAVRGFPISAPDAWVAFLDAKDEEIGTLPSLRGLDEVSETIIQEELRRRYFVPRVLRIAALRAEHGLIQWDVETDRGHRTYWVRSVRRSEGGQDAVDIGDDRLLLTDVAGTRFEVVRSAMDDRSRALLDSLL